MIKSLRNLFAGMVFLTISQLASAICFQSQKAVPEGYPPMFQTGGMFCTQNNVPPHVQGISQGVVVQPVYVSGGIPSGVPVGNASQCAGLFERGGRVIGANRGNDARSTENAGLLGYIMGSLFCPTMNNQSQGPRSVQLGQINNVSVVQPVVVTPSVRNVLPNYGTEATVRDGHTCAHNVNGVVVVDYFDRNRNPEGIELPSQGSGARCQEMRQTFKARNNLS